MTRIFTDGAEMGDVLFWTSTGGASATTSNPSPRSGAFSYVFGGNPYKSIPAVSEGYLRVAYNLAGGISNSDGMLIGFYSGGTQLLTLNLGTSTYKYMAKRSGTLLSTGSFVYANSTWYYLEIYVKIDGSVGRFVVRANGLLDIDYTGNTKPGSDTTFNRIYFGSVCANQGNAIDDLAFNDTDNSDGRNDNSWCGDGRIIKLTPSGSSATTNSWGNSGSVSGSANYLYVDEYPNDGDTTYTYASGSSTGAQDQYELSNYSGTPMISISRIWAETRAKMATTGSDYIKIGYLPNGGTDQLSASAALSTAYTEFKGTSASANPVTGLPWTIDDINGLEYVIEVG